jgi:hypothetical protein
MTKDTWPLVIISCCITVPLTHFARQLGIDSAVFSVGVAAIVFFIVLAVLPE